MVLTREEKTSWVIKLANEGKTIRDIAEIVHMSFGDISYIIRRETGEAEEQNRIRLSKASQALQLPALQRSEMIRKREYEIMHYYAHMSVENANLKTELES